MPASGKSAVGALLAARIGAEFTDGDDLIRERAKKSLATVIAERGAEGFLALEEEVLCAFSPRDREVFAPGGSAVYSQRAMEHLKRLGTVIYLRVTCETVAARIPDLIERGVVMRGNIRTVEELYRERVPLYERYADVTVDADEPTVEEMAEEIVRKLGIS